ncbi:putative toxin-antitoxin system toxin component, PIN family [Candidatus Albibeggiatoa sp. nov. BB20]|uniref:putative toxin-antitoxin system toxin component, PIN family n=1 Tax=Candidatus Albibeggiatoa sp. nov. BB20 TaxID=3162723 RepID=UPI00336581BF
MNKFVLDTNVLLVSISSKSKYHWMYRTLLEQKYDLFISNEILTEYEEIIGLKYNPYTAERVVKSLLSLSNIHFITVHYRWHLIKDDKDDDKFVDCAIASNVNYIVTEDKHFNILKNIEFPKVNVISIAEFKKLIMS